MSNRTIRPASIRDKSRTPEAKAATVARRAARAAKRSQGGTK